MKSGGNNLTMEEYALLFQQGDEKGFDFFFKLYYKALCFFANKYVKDMAVAEDIVAESFIKLWEMRSKIDERLSLKSLLFTVVRNAAISYLRKQKTLEKRKSGYETLNSEETEAYMLQQMIATETMQEIYAAISGLPEGCRNVFTRLYVEGMTVKEIAEELGLSVNTVKTQKTRGLAFIRGKLKSFLLLTVIVVEIRI